jgi:expansin (peptidoglycan-binding protein)
VNKKNDVQRSKWWTGLRVKKETFLFVSLIIYQTHWWIDCAIVEQYYVFEFCSGLQKNRICLWAQ